MSWREAVVAITTLAMIMAYNAAILGVTAYAVFWMGRSGWWFLLALILCASTGRSK